MVRNPQNPILIIKLLRLPINTKALTLAFRRSSSKACLMGRSCWKKPIRCQVCLGESIRVHTEASNRDPPWPVSWFSDAVFPSYGLIDAPSRSKQCLGCMLYQISRTTRGCYDSHSCFRPLYYEAWRLDNLNRVLWAEYSTTTTIRNAKE